MKHLLLTTALITAGAAGSAFAQTNDAANNDTAMTGATGSAFMTEQGENQVRASDFIGMRVYAAADTGDMTEADGASDNWEDIGEINDVIMSREGNVQAVLLDIGGFLGLGERQVAANLDQIQFVSDNSTEDAGDFFLVLNQDPDSLGDAPAYGSDQASMTSGTSDTMKQESTDMASADTSNEVGAELDDAGDDMAAAADDAGDAIEAGAENVEQTAENTGENIEEGAEDMAQSAEATGERMEDGAEDMAQSAEATGEEMENDAENMASDTNNSMTGETNNDMAMVGTPVEQAYMTAENLDGARVYDSNDKWVGEISELVVAEDGQITDAIVDVGGFLGIGEKPVALKLADLQILRQDGSEEVRIYTAMAEDELEAMPEFEKQ